MKYFLSFLFLAFFVNLQAQEWENDINIALERASNENKKVILVFSGSDWCAPCIKLEREIWNSPEFVEYSKHHFIMLRADFPRKKKNQLSEEQQKKNAMLFEKYNPEGYFPLVVVLNSKGEVLGTTTYKKISPEEYINELNSFK